MSPIDVHASTLPRRLDAATRAFWRVAGRRLDLDGEHAWLDAPTSEGSAVADGWLEGSAAALGGSVREIVGDGLLPDLAHLDGPGFTAGDLLPDIRDFYERTSCWRMEVWSQWSPLFAPGGELVSRLFGRRVQQLSLPMRPLDVAHGMDSRVATLIDADGVQQAAAWIRTLRSTGEYVFSGCYTSRTLPGAQRPSVHVTFPLESGNVQVFLSPRVLPGGGLELASPSGGFGEDGAYVTATSSGGVHGARVPVHETFRLDVDEEGVLRCDHDLRMWGATAVRLHYKLIRAAD